MSHIWSNFDENIYKDIVFIRFLRHCQRWRPLIPKAHQHIYEHKYVCGQSWVKFPSFGWDMVFTKSQGFSGHCLFWPWCLTFWPNKYVPRYWRYCIHPVFRSMSAMTFDFLMPKSNQHIYECKYICDQNWVKSPSLVWEIWYRPPAVTLTFWSNQYVTGPSTYMA